MKCQNCGQNIEILFGEILHIGFDSLRMRNFLSKDLNGCTNPEPEARK